MLFWKPQDFEEPFNELQRCLLEEAETREAAMRAVVASTNAAEGLASGSALSCALRELVQVWRERGVLSLPLLLDLEKRIF
jgi:hypothetical protein